MDSSLNYLLIQVVRLVDPKYCSSKLILHMLEYIATFSLSAGGSTPHLDEWHSRGTLPQQFQLTKASSPCLCYSQVTHTSVIHSYGIFIVMLMTAYAND